MSDLQLTKEFKETTAAISSDILQNPQKYRQAGEWLDQYYDKEFCQKKMKERSDRLLVDVFVNGFRRGEYYSVTWDLHHVTPVEAYEILQAVAMVELNHFVSISDVLKRGDLLGISHGTLTSQEAKDIVATWGLKKSYSWLKDRLWLAHKEMLEIKEQCKLFGQEESVIVCLLTWLLANPDAHRAALGITEFERWEWYSSYESGVYSQRADVIQLLDTCEMLQDWQNLACEAWQNIENKRLVKAEQEQSSKTVDQPVVTVQEDEPDDPLSWMSDSLAEIPRSAEQWVGPFDPTLRFDEDTEGLTDILTLKDCITHLKKILQYWVEYQFISPKSDILAEMTHTLRCWLVKVRHDSNQKLPPIPPDLIGMVDWIPDVEKMLAEGTTRKETDSTVQEQSSKHIIEPAEIRQYPIEHREFLTKVASSVHELIQDQTNRKEFQEQLRGFRNLRDKFARALQEAQEAALADPKLRYDYDDVRDQDKDPPLPPVEGYEVERHHVLKTPPKGFWRPKLPFNPNGWLSRFQSTFLGLLDPPAEEPRDRDQMLACEYALLAAIHDEGLDIPACDRLSDSNQDDWVESLWIGVCQQGTTQDAIGMLPYRQKYIETALSNVKTNLAERAAETQQRTAIGKEKAEIEVQKEQKQAEEVKKKLKTNHTALIKAMSQILKEGNITDITRDALVLKTNYSVGSGAVNQAYIDLKTWGIIRKDGQNFTPEFQHYKENPSD